jgi:prolyl-tRNA editing enzyme YbaK/EbsC (Cys-tRNA(Pro) deacylase)
VDATASETPDATEQRVRQIVAQFNADKPDINARVIDCDPNLADTAQFVEAYGFTLGQSANTLIVIGKSDPPVYVACVVLANTRLDVNKVVRKKLGVKKCSFAPAEMTEELSGMKVGGVTPLGLSEYMPLWVDSRVIALSEIVLGGGSRACKFVGSPEILTSLPNVEVVEDLAKPIPEAPSE